MKTDHYYAAPKNYYTCCLALIYVSMVIVILDGIFGLDIFLTGSDRLSPIYRAAFFLKLVIVTFGIFIYCDSAFDCHISLSSSAELIFFEAAIPINIYSSRLYSSRS